MSLWRSVRTARQFGNWLTTSVRCSSASPRMTGPTDSASMFSCGPRPASSQIVGFTSISSTSASLVRPPAMPGPQTISGTRIALSYITSLAYRPWSPSISP